MARLVCSIIYANIHLNTCSVHPSQRKSLDHWPSLTIDHTVRKSFEPCTVIIDRILNKIFDGYDKNTNDLLRPTDISDKTYHLNIGGRDMTPMNPEGYMITAYTDGSKHSDNSTGYGVPSDN